MPQLDVLRAQLWQILKDEYALIAPAGSMATPQGDKGPVGRPQQTLVRGRQRIPVSGAADNRASTAANAVPTQSGFASVNRAGQLAMGAVPRILSRGGLSQLWIDSVEKMPIAAVPPQIRKSLYQTLTHRVGNYPLNDKWYPILKEANTRSDVRWRVTKPPVQGPGNTPRGVSMAPRYQFRKAWRVPRYSTNPDVAVPQSRNP
jgi:hypothetical protein